MILRRIMVTDNKPTGTDTDILPDILEIRKKYQVIS
jgi:hypothetical protein